MTASYIQCSTVQRLANRNAVIVYIIKQLLEVLQPGSMCNQIGNLQLSFFNHLHSIFPFIDWCLRIEGIPYTMHFQLLTKKQGMYIQLYCCIRMGISQPYDGTANSYDLYGIIDSGRASGSFNHNVNAAPVCYDINTFLQIFLSGIDNRKAAFLCKFLLGFINICQDDLRSTKQ